MQRLFDSLVYVGAIAGGFFVYAALFSDASAPQQGALAALAVALVAIPYCFAATAHRALMRSRSEPPERAAVDTFDQGAY